MKHILLHATKSDYKPYVTLDDEGILHYSFVILPPNNEIRYTSVDGEVVDLYGLDFEDKRYTLLNNTDGKMVFDAPITTLGGGSDGLVFYGSGLGVDAYYPTFADNQSIFKVIKRE